MTRFFGMMPSDEVKKEKTYTDDGGLTVTIQAGENGWTILWGDGCSTFLDIVNTADANFEHAYVTAINDVGKLTEVQMDLEV